MPGIDAGIALPSRKAEFRKSAAARRKAAHSLEAESEAVAKLERLILSLPAKSPVSGYLPIRSEISPVAAMESLYCIGRRICVPVVAGPDSPLQFREWTPVAELEGEAFGTKVPVSGDWLVPGILIVPLLAFDRRGIRLGYGGGHYDRTLQELRTMQPTIAIGLAFAGQECRRVPAESHDQILDAVVTEREVLVCSAVLQNLVEA